MTIGFLILILGVCGIVALDFAGKNKLWAVGAMFVALALYNPHGITHAWSEAWPMTSFLFAVMLLANYVQESGGLTGVSKYINNKWLLGYFIFIVSVFFDNTVATMLGVGIAIAKKSPRFAVFASVMALLGGLFSPIGDVTSTMTWIGGKMTASGLIAMGPACLIGAIYFIWAIGEMGLTFNAPQALNSKNSWLKLGVGLLLFATIPVLKGLHLKVNDFEITQPGVIAPIMAIIGFLAYRFGFGEKMNLKPHDAGEWKATVKTVAYIFLILGSVGFLHHDLEMIKGDVSNLHIGVLIFLSIIISSHVDNVPWTAILIAVVPYATDSIEWQMLVIALGLAGGLSPVGSTSTLVASSLLGVGFKDFYKESYKIFILIAIVMGVVYFQHLIFG